MGLFNFFSSNNNGNRAAVQSIAFKISFRPFGYKLTYFFG